MIVAMAVHVVTMMLRCCTFALCRLLTVVVVAATSQ